MPAVSAAQRTAAAIALHAPQKLYKKNRGLLKMSGSQLHEFTSFGPQRGLAQQIQKQNRRSFQ